MQLFLWETNLINNFIIRFLNVYVFFNAHGTSISNFRDATRRVERFDPFKSTLDVEERYISLLYPFTKSG